jgi:release factor glutamine methyltransferase
LPRPYQPDEDSEFLLKCVAEALEPRGIARGLEIGCGTGFATHGLLELGAVRLAVCGDLDPDAAEAARERLRGMPADAVVCDAAEPFRNGSFDAVYFNPPYLPCEREEDPAVCGGGSGADVALHFLESSRDVLKGGGRTFALIGSENAEELDEAANGIGLVGRVRCRLRMFFEELVILEFLTP